MAADPFPQDHSLSKQSDGSRHLHAQGVLNGLETGHLMGDAAETADAGDQGGDMLHPAALHKLFKAAEIINHEAACLDAPLLISISTLAFPSMRVAFLRIIFLVI